jgi:hypothetical protein
MQELLNRLNSAIPPDPDWLLWTDGSGHTDGIEVSCAWFMAPRVNFVGTVLSGSTRGSVNRAELKALLDGLHGILEQERRHAGKGTDWTPPWPKTVVWRSDRQNLVLGVARDPLTGKPLNSRDTDADLWLRFSWYEVLFRIHPVLVPRNAVAWQKKCDTACGMTRKVLKKWLAHLRRKYLHR